MDCSTTGPVVADLVAQHPGRFAAVTYHVHDNFEVPWGLDRFENFYSVAATPTLMYDGWLSCPMADYGACLAQRLGVATDVTIDLSGAQVSSSTWDVRADVCIESGGSNKNLRIYTAATLLHPDLPAYSTNVIMQAALTEDVSVSAGNCQSVTQRITFDSISLANQNDITIVAWAQNPLSPGPADVHQAAIMDWPFPQGSELTTIEISPSTAEIAVGESQSFTATGKDQFGSDFPLSNPVWTITGTGDGTLAPPSGSATTEFQATLPGDVQVICSDGAISGQASVVVTGDPPIISEIVVSPTSTEMQVGQKKIFAAVAYDQYGVEFLMDDPQWQATGDGSGSFDPPNGSTTPLFTAETPGDVLVVCSEQGISGEASVLITGDPPYLVSLEVSPQTATLPVGSSLVFTASGTDQYGDPFPLDSLSWSISGDGNGSFDPATGSETTFTATAVGDCTIKASQDGIEAEVSVDVIDPGLPKPRKVKARHTP